MNKIFNVVWSAKKGQMVVASELARGYQGTVSSVDRRPMDHSGMHGVNATKGIRSATDVSAQSVSQHRDSFRLQKGSLAAAVSLGVAFAAYNVNAYADVSFGSNAVVVTNGSSANNNSISGFNGTISVSGAGSEFKGNKITAATNGAIKSISAEEGGLIEGNTYSPGISATGVPSGVKASGSGSKILESHLTVNGMNINNSEAGLVFAVDGGQIDLSDSNIISTADQAGGGLRAVNSRGNGITTTINLDNTDVLVDASGVKRHDSNVDTIDGTPVFSYGNRASAITATYGGTVNVNQTSLGAVPEDERNTIKTIGDYVFGIEADNGPSNTNKNSQIKANNVAVDTEGSHSFGVKVAEDTSVTLTNASVQTTGLHALGAQVKGAGASFTATNVDITTSGNESTGLAVDGGGSATLSNVNVRTGGKNADAVAADGSGSTVTLSGGNIQTDYRRGSGGGNAGIATHALLAKNGGTITGTGLVISGSNDGYFDGVVSVQAGSTITLKDSSVSNTMPYSDFSAAGATADGEGALLKLHGTSVFVESSKTSVGSSAAAIGVTHGGEVYINQGDSAALSSDRDQIQASGKLVKGIIAANGSGNILSANNVTVTTDGESGYGIQVGADEDGSSSVELINSDVQTSGSAADGVHVTSAATGDARFTGQNLNVMTDGQNAKGVSADGAGSSISLHDSSITTSGNATGLLLTAGSKATLDGTTIDSFGEEAVKVIGGSTLDMTGGHIYNTRAEPSSCTGVGVPSGCTSPSAGAIGLLASGADTSVQTDGTDIRAQGDYASAGESSVAVKADQGATVSLKGGQVEHLDGRYGRGIQILSGAHVSTEGTDIRTTGYRSHAVQVFGGDASTPTGITLQDGQVSTEGFRSFGLFAQNAGSQVSATGTNITTTGEESLGASASGGGSLSLDDVSITTSGARAHGVELESGASATIKDSSITSSSADASGIFVQNNGTVGLTGTTVVSGGASITSQFTTADQTQSITIGDGSKLTQNNGTLLQVSREGDGLDGIVNLVLASGSVSQGDIADTDRLDEEGRGKTNLTLENGAQWDGTVLGTAGDTTVGDGASYHSEGDADIDGDVTGGTGSSVIFDQNTTISGDVDGTGTSFQFSTDPDDDTEIGGDVNLNDGSELQGGSAGNPIQIGGDASVNDSTLGGNLLITGQLSGTGMTLSPGNSVGVITVGSVSSSASGTYGAEVNQAGQSDLVRVQTGDFNAANFDLVIGQENGVGGAKLNHQYTILQTLGGSVNNQFDSQSLDPSFDGTLVKLDPVHYGTQQVQVSLSADQDKVRQEGAAMDHNQRATLNGLASMTGINDMADAVLANTHSMGQRQGALDQLSGELHASTQAALVQESSLISSMIMQRARGNLGAGTLPGQPLAAAGDSVPAGAMPQSAALPLWVQAVGNWGHLDGDDGAAEVSTNMGGLFLGGDADVGQGWRLGGALGYTDGRVKVDDRDSRSDVKSYTASIYGGNSWAKGSGNVNFLAGAAYTYHDVDSRRDVNVGYSQTLKGSYHGNTTQLFTELGYAMPVGKASTVEPYLNLTWLNQHTQGFDESGGSAALDVDSQSSNTVLTTLGLRGSTAVDLGNQRSLSLSGGVGWRHAGGDVNFESENRFIQGGGNTFTVEGAPIAKDAAVVDAGLGLTLSRSSVLGLSYSGQFGDGNNHSGTVYLRTRF